MGCHICFSIHSGNIYGLAKLVLHLNIPGIKLDAFWGEVIIKGSKYNTKLDKVL